MSWKDELHNLLGDVQSVNGPVSDDSIIIDTRVFDDPTLSLGAIGVMVFLYGKPPDWECSIQDISDQGLAWGKEPETIMGELEKSGWVERSQTKDGVTVWRVAQHPRKER